MKPPTSKPVPHSFSSSTKTRCLFPCSDTQAPRPLPGTFAANLRIMVNNVDAVWKRLHDLNVGPLLAIADRDYGLWDFTVTGTDGIAIRLGSRFSGLEEH